uniref:Uncharacterized protein n=1 Tax=Arundo donax TaxID=35708 RepID=A0A0A9DYA6_ARUDO
MIVLFALIICSSLSSPPPHARDFSFIFYLNLTSHQFYRILAAT